MAALRFITTLFFTYVALVPQFCKSQERNILWYKSPAANWNEALPIGNGFVGAMIFGNAQQERLQLNECTIWGGGPNNNIDSAARPYINELRALLAERKYDEAQKLANARLGPKGNSGMPYQLAGDLLIDWPGHTEVTDYRRELNIHNALASVSYTVGGVRYKREYFTSFTDKVLIVRLSADKPSSISCRVSLKSPLKKAVYTNKSDLLLSGSGSDHENQAGKVKFNIATRVKTSGGSSKTDSSSIIISKADEAVIYLSVATNFVDYQDLSADAESRALDLLNNAFKKSFTGLLKQHTSFYKGYFDRVKLDLGVTDAFRNPTDLRINNFAKTKDPQLAELYFQFGRYLLISSSQPGAQAANLQGIWNGELKGPWDSKYTININTEMNYWPSEVTRLSELNAPFFDLIRDLSVTGRPAAQQMYGARGWVAHHNTDIWRITGVVDGAFWGLWPTSNAWLCQHLWEHYLYTGDKNFLRKYYPVMKGAAEYFIDVLQTEPRSKWLVVSPSISPEHEYKNGVSVTAGATMDNQLVWGLFTMVARAAAELNTDKLFADSVILYRNKLPPMQIGKHAQLQEWLEDFDEPTDKHRHVSHLYGLFPAEQISPYRNPEIFAAAKNSLVYRGDVSTGWSMAWKINLWARLQDGNHAYKLITDQISPVTSRNQSGGTYPNLFDAHPPFQIDGNFGCTSGIAEMLLQSHDGAVQLLPALPDAWPDGSISGLKSRGGFIIDMVWKDKKLTKLTIHSESGGICRLRLPMKSTDKSLTEARGINPNTLFKTADIKDPIINHTGQALNAGIRPSWLYDLKTSKGGSYTIVFNDQP